MSLFIALFEMNQCICIRIIEKSFLLRLKSDRQGNSARSLSFHVRYYFFFDAFSSESARASV